MRAGSQTWKGKAAAIERVLLPRELSVPNPAGAAGHAGCNAPYVNGPPAVTGTHRQIEGSQLGFASGCFLRACGAERPWQLHVVMHQLQ